MEVIIMSKKLFGYTALFDTPDAIMAAAKKTAHDGFTKFDVHTPYPVHGIEKAMKIQPSKLGYITLFFGLFGGALAMLFMYWTMSVDYPMVIGGKPFFALPAFGPVTFEVIVLTATLSTVAAMIALFFYLPQNNHPLHDTDYMKNVSSDKYGICIEAEDPLFDETKVQTFLAGVGGKTIAPVYNPEPVKYPLLQPKFLAVLAVVALSVSGATYFTLNKLMYMTPFNWMAEQEKLTPQRTYWLFEDGYGMRMPVQGTVARGFMPYPFRDQPVLEDEGLPNPLLATEEVLTLGKNKYNTFCSPCHGNHGDGDSRLRGQFPNPPSLHTTRARDWSDGQIYHVLTVGQNVMASYEPYTTREERWAIVHYIRALQRAKNASDADIQLVRSENNGR
jgi:mono/diheme cytochrome c family protein